MQPMGDASMDPCCTTLNKPNKRIIVHRGIFLFLLGVSQVGLAVCWHSVIAPSQLCLGSCS